MNPLLFLLVGGAAIFGIMQLTKKSASAASPPATAASLDAAFNAAIKEIEGDKALQSAMTLFGQRIGSMVGSVSEMVSTLRAHWVKDASTLNGVSGELGAGALMPVADETDFGRVRGWTLKVGKLFYDKSILAGNKKPSLTLYSADAALENSQWLPNAQALIGKLIEVVTAMKGSALTNSEKQKMIGDTVIEWISEDPKVHVNAALQIKPMLLDATMPSTMATAAKNLIGLETARAKRLGASAADLAAIASTAMDATPPAP